MRCGVALSFQLAFVGLVIGGCSAPLPRTFAAAQSAFEVLNRAAAARSHAEQKGSARSADELSKRLTRCKDQGGRDIERYEFILVLNERGGVIRSYEQPRTPLSTCLATQFKGISWPTPPSAPYFVSLSIDRSMGEKNADQFILGEWSSNNALERERGR
jgi:putative hemolysin